MKTNLKSKSTTSAQNAWHRRNGSMFLGIFSACSQNCCVDFEPESGSFRIPKTANSWIRPRLEGLTSHSHRYLKQVVIIKKGMSTEKNLNSKIKVWIGFYFISKIKNFYSTILNFYAKLELKWLFLFLKYQSMYQKYLCSTYRNFQVKNYEF